MENGVGCEDLQAAWGLAVTRTEMTVESFLELVEQSGVIASDQMQQLREELAERYPQLDSNKKVAHELVTRGMLTRWQAEQLLLGKHRGFFLGPYRILELLGSGGMGRVYLAEHQMMRRRCAIKVLPPKESKRESSIVDRFYREAQAVAALDHPNIVQAYDVNKTRLDETEVHYLVMEYVDGQDLQKMVTSRAALDYGQAADFIRQTAEGLAHAHQRGLVHRDVKPANLIVDRQNVVKILDLGLAWCFDEDAETTAAGQPSEGVAGTADYLAPEQATDSQNVDWRADVYSLGQTFYFLLTGRPPFPGGTVPERLFAHQTKLPEPITNTRSDAPPGLLAIIEKMTAKQPSDRYASMDELVDALDEWLAEYAEEGSSRALSARVSGGVTRWPPSSESSTRAAGAASEETDLGFAPLEDDERPASPSPSPPPAVAANRHGHRTPPRGDTAAPSDSRRPSTSPVSSPPDDAKADGKSPVGEDLADLPPLNEDLVAALGEDLSASEPLSGEPAAVPGGQGLLGPQSLRKPTQKPGPASLLEMPAVWIGVAGLVVIALIVAFVVHRYSADEAQQPAAKASPEPTGQKPPPPPPQNSKSPVNPPPPPPPGPDSSPDEPGKTPATPPDEHAATPPTARPTDKPQVIVPVGSTFRWLHPTDGTDPSAEDRDFHATFCSLDYDDSHWQEGRDAAGSDGGFGYGDAVEVAFERPVEEHRKTAYFRHAFKTDVAMKNLTISLQRDDGIIVYLDGEEVGRDNVGNAEEAHDLFAKDVISGSQETKVNRFELTGRLPPGEHVLAISLHNRSGGSSDLRIAEISLSGVPAASSGP